MNNAQRLKALSDTGRNIFSVRNMSEIWGAAPGAARISVSRMEIQGLLRRIARGYYSLRREYDPLELANIMVRPSYISLQAALFFHGFSSQIRSSVESAALYSYERKIEGRTFKYFALKESIFFHMEGIMILKNVTVAKPERAVLDCLYFGFFPAIDRPRPLNRRLLDKIAAVYPATVRKKAEAFFEKIRP